MWFNDYPFILFFVAIFIAFLANSSGFSGAVYFQPFFYFFTDVPLKESISTGIATETIGMSSGALAYWRYGKIRFDIIRRKIPWVIIGIVIGFIILKIIERKYLKFIVGLSMLVAGFVKLWSLFSAPSSQKNEVSGVFSLMAGLFSASTGTGNAEIHQPLLEHKEGLDIKNANATAIGLEAIGNVVITLINLVVNDLRFDILAYTIPGVLIGSQLGVFYGLRAPSKLLLVVFSLSIIWIGIIYLAI